jgi:ATP-dependent RNA helicase DDX42
LDHASIQYESFRKVFYTEAPEVKCRTPAENHDVLAELNLVVTGNDLPTLPRPIMSFVHAGFDRKLLRTIADLGLEAPTPIQSQALPLILSGKDLIGIAQTGSGKTFAFVLPMMVHIMDQRHLARSEGPIAVIVAPTRELAHQICIETRKFAKVSLCSFFQESRVCSFRPFLLCIGMSWSSTGL